MSVIVDIVYKDTLPGAGHGSHKGTQTMCQVAGKISGLYTQSGGEPITAAQLGLSGIEVLVIHPQSVEDTPVVPTTALSLSAQTVAATEVAGVIPSVNLFLKIITDSSGIGVDAADGEAYICTFQAFGPSADVGTDTRA